MANFLDRGPNLLKTVGCSARNVTNLLSTRMAFRTTLTTPQSTRGLRRARIQEEIERLAKLVCKPLHRLVRPVTQAVLLPQLPVALAILW